MNNFLSLRRFFAAGSPANQPINQKSVDRRHRRVLLNSFLMTALLLQNVLLGFPVNLVNAAEKRSVSDKSSRLSPAVAFTTGDLAVLQTAENDSNSPASIVELNPSTLNTTPVQTLAVPSGTANAGLRFSGSATSTGYLATTNDGSLLTFTGANSDNTTANVNTLNPRGVGTFNNAGTYNLATTYTANLTGNPQTRGATSLNNSTYYIGDQGGLYTNNATAASPTGNLRSVKSFGGTVYAFQASTTVPPVSTVSAPSGGTLTPLPGVAANNNAQDFYLISSGDNGATFDVLYVLSATSNTAGAIAKYSLVSGSWTANGTYTTTFGGFGLAASDNGNGAFLYASTGQGALTANSVLRLSDTAGYNAAISISTASNLTLYTAPTGTIVKGVAFAPQAVAVAAPEINVTGNGATIADGDATPSAADFTDFGNVAAGGSFDRTYTIQNVGTANLTVGTVTVTGTNAGDFSVVSAPTSPVAPNGSTVFTVRFTPSAVNLRTATVNIANNDGDENPYDFAVQGTGISSATPTISENTASPSINLPANGSGFLSGTVNDATDPGRTFGIDLTIADADTPTSSLTVTAASSNQTVVPDANLNLSGADGARNLKITPAGTGYATITVTVSDGGSSASYTINYAASVPSNQTAATRWHTGKADASTAIAVDADYMFVADDEDQGLRLYNRNNSGLPLAVFDFTANLGLTDPNPTTPREVDIEASAQSGNRIYWLGSHSNSSGGGNRPNRSRLFATDISGTGAAATLTYVGRYDNLKADLINWDANNLHGLGANYFGLAASAATGVIPESADGGGFNIEGLTLAPGDTTGYIAFRAPIVPATNRTRALLVPVTNFTALVAGNPTAATATFGAPLQFDLGGLGIREIKKNSSNEYLIVAGSASSGGVFRIYTWTGNPSDAPIRRTTDLSGMNPEAVVEVPSGINSFAPNAALPVQFLSDNGDDVYYGDGVIAKELPNNEFKKFRSDVRVVSLSPTAASVRVAGRVLDHNNRGVSKAFVRLLSADGTTRTALTNPFGYYRFNEVAAGETYVFTVESKRHIFTPQVISIVGEITDLNFVGDE